MKVLFVQPSCALDGGAEKVIVRMANYLTSKHIANTILTCDMNTELRKRIDQRGETRLVLCKDYNELGYVYSKIYQDFDVVHLHNWPTPMLTYGNRHPTVWSCNEPPQNFEDGGRFLKKEEIPEQWRFLVDNHLNRVILADKFNKDRFINLFGIKEESTTIIPYGIDYEFFANEKESDADVRINGGGEAIKLKDKFVISHVAYVHPMKNQKDTLKAFIKVKKKIKNAVLLFVGQNDHAEYMNELKTYMRVNKLTDNEVIFTGFVSQEEVRNIMYASDVVMHPVKEQGGWLTAFDAMCTKTPVIVSKDMTASPLVKEAGGYVGDYDKNILKVYKEKPNFHKSREWVYDNLTWKKYCDSIMEEYERAIDEYETITDSWVSNPEWGFDESATRKEIEEFAAKRKRIMRGAGKGPKTKVKTSGGGGAANVAQVDSKTADWRDGKEHSLDENMFTDAALKIEEKVKAKDYLKEAFKREKN